MPRNSHFYNDSIDRLDREIVTAEDIQIMLEQAVMDEKIDREEYQDLSRELWEGDTISRDSFYESEG